ncbi:hypothetical protein SAMN02787118_1327 [Streptomyces mirabilis]|uniref:Uncharacterized protein n=1 Tax=Streptomyces mirabilis TaxID=68239 RepID=A0A1I2VHZ3_9ACTN|nr:hypothetical protein SAMN02787118_1327 [Streptomyces mirabilis]
MKSCPKSVRWMKIAVRYADFDLGQATTKAGSWRGKEGAAPGFDSPGRHPLDAVCSDAVYGNVSFQLLM